MNYDDYKLFGIRIPDAGETPLSWEEILVWLRIKQGQSTMILDQGD